jgi:hypothetical protein
VHVPRDWYVPSDAFGWRAVVVLFGVLLGALASLPWLVDRWGLLAMAPVLPLIGAYVYKLTILMHECCHRTLFRARPTNDLVGLVCGGVLVTSYDAFCRAHWQHHRHCGTDEDGEESDYLTLQDASASGLVLHLLKPLLGVQAARMALAALRAIAGRRGASGGPAAAAAPQARPRAPSVSWASRCWPPASAAIHGWRSSTRPRRRRSACSSVACGPSANTCGWTGTSASVRCDRTCPIRSIGPSSTR